MIEQWNLHICDVSSGSTGSGDEPVSAGGWDEGVASAAHNERARCLG